MSLLVFHTVATDVFSLTSLSHASPFTGIVLKDCPEFDLMFENAFDQWVAGSAGEKCTFIQVLHHTCQRYSSARKPEFINCQSKLLGGKMIKNNAANWPLLLFFFLSGTQWLCHARLAAVMLCCNPVWLCMMTPSTWHTRECMHITHTIHLLNVLLKRVQWGSPALTVTQDFRLTGSKHIIKLKALLNINLPLW